MDKTHFPIGSEVILNTFLSTKKPSNHKISNQNNYWLLIGKKGKIVGDELSSIMPRHRNGNRYLVQFDEDVCSLGLVCHNEISNSLWIFSRDLILI